MAPLGKVPRGFPTVACVSPTPVQGGHSNGDKGHTLRLHASGECRPLAAQRWGNHPATLPSFGHSSEGCTQPCQSTKARPAPHLPQKYPGALPLGTSHTMTTSEKERLSYAHPALLPTASDTWPNMPPGDCFQEGVCDSSTSFPFLPHQNLLFYRETKQICRGHEFCTGAVLLQEYPFWPRSQCIYDTIHLLIGEGGKGPLPFEWAFEGTL